jgi:hypothetical protein
MKKTALCLVALSGLLGVETTPQAMVKLRRPRPLILSILAAVIMSIRTSAWRSQILTAG